MKSMTLRLTDEQAAALELTARTDGQRQIEIVRVALDAYIEERRRDEAFMERLHQRHQRDVELYERLAR